jgi:ABC-type branched-subunit amino acid transport system permease subunit
VLTLAAGLVMIVAAVGTRRLLTLTLALAGLLGALVLPLTAAGNWLEPSALSIALAIAALGVVVVTGWAGELFLAPLAIAGLAAYATAWFAGDQGQPLVIAVTYALALGIIAGAVIGLLCAVQRSGAVVAVVSLGLAAVLDAALFRSHAVGGTRRLTPALSQPLRMGNYQIDADVVLYYALLLVLVVCVLLVLVLRDSRFALMLRAGRSGAGPSEARGVDVTATRFAAYLVATGLAAVAGCCAAVDTGRVTPETFSPLNSLLLVGLVLLLGRSRVTAAIPAGAVVGAVPLLMSRYHPIAGYRAADLDLAVGALLLVVVVGRELLGARARAWLERSPLAGVGRGRRRPDSAPGGLTVSPPPSQR